MQVPIATGHERAEILELATTSLGLMLHIAIRAWFKGKHFHRCAHTANTFLFHLWASEQHSTLPIFSV